MRSGMSLPDGAVALNIPMLTAELCITHLPLIPRGRFTPISWPVRSIEQCRTGEQGRSPSSTPAWKNVRDDLADVCSRRFGVSCSWMSTRLQPSADSVLRLGRQKRRVRVSCTGSSAELHSLGVSTGLNRTTQRGCRRGKDALDSPASKPTGSFEAITSKAVSRTAIFQRGSPVRDDAPG